MIEDFLQRKLAGVLDSFIEFEKLKFTTADGMTIQNSTIRPKLVELLSEVLQMPLELISGSISSLTLNKPWEKLFLFMNSPIKIITEGIRLRTKLKSTFSEDFTLRKKRHLIESLTQNLMNPMQTSKNSSSFVNQKLKEYFLSTIVLQAKNVYLQIEIDLKHRVELILKLDSLIFRKEDKKSSDCETIHLQIQGVGLYYRAMGNKEIDLISPTRIDFKRVKTEGGAQNKRVSKKSLSVEKLHLNVNNINYGDIARVILLIQWHNSFLNLPLSLWRNKPSVLGESKPFNKFLYCAQLIRLSIAEQRIQTQLIQRRKYMKIYNKMLSDPTSSELIDKNILSEMEKQMPVWKITAYRSFCINMMKKKRQERIRKLEEKQKAAIEDKEKRNNAETVPEFSNVNEEKVDNIKKQENSTSVNLNEIQQIKKSNTSWFRSWMGSQKNPEELQMQFLSKLDAIELIPSDIQSIFNFKVEQIQIKVSIVTSNFGGEPFISLIGIHCEYNATQLLKDGQWKKDITFRKCKIEYQKYLGNHQRYKNLLGESKSISQSQIRQQDQSDQFQDINYFLQVHFTNQSKVIDINLLPFDIFINYEIIEKLAIIMNIDWLGKIDKIDRLEKAFIIHYDPWIIVQDEKRDIINIKTQKEVLSSSKKKQINQLQVPIFQNQNLFKNRQKLKQQRIKKFTPQIQIKSALNLIIPMDLRSYPTTQLSVQISEILINIKDLKKKVKLKGIQVKGYFMAKGNSEGQEKGIKDMYNYYMSSIEKVLIRKFNIQINHQNHENFDSQAIVVSPIKIQIPQREHMLTLIELISLHIPRSKESRAKQYYRRKQSIGQEFMDACENLNEQIAKSMIMSSQKQMKRSIIRDKRTHQVQILFQGVIMSSKNLSLQLNECNLNISQMGYDQKTFQSHNSKKGNMVVYNIRQMMEDIQAYQLQIKKQLSKRGLISENQNKGIKINKIEVTDINFELLIFLKKLKRNETPSLCLELKNISFIQEQQQSCRSITAIIKLSYDQQIDMNKKRRIPLIEAFRISYIQMLKFNLHQKTVSVNSLNINIKPSLLKMLADLIKDYYLSEQTGCTLTNGTINSIKIKNNLNYNKELKSNQKCIINSYVCDLILFNSKLQLSFNDHKEDVPKQKTQCFNISQNNLLINREIQPNNYLLQSNIRILNHQDKAIWIKITESSSVILPEEYETTRIHLNELSLTPKRPFDVDLTQKLSINDNQLSLNDDINRNRKRRISQHGRAGKNVSIPLKAKQKISILIDQEDHKYFQIYDQGSTFTEIKIAQLFEETEILLKNQESEQNQYLIIRSQITSSEGIEGSIYTFHILSPIYIVNKTPWTLEYRLSDDQVQWVEGEQKKRRSFEVIPLKKISSLSAQKIRNKHFNEIQTMKLSINKHQRDITNLGSLIAKMKDRKVKVQGQFCKDSQLITLRSNRTQIQMVLRLQFSKNILKIKLYPQYIFINLTKLQIKFKIKQDQITYPQILLQPLQIESRKEQNKQQKERRLTRQAYIKQFINQSDEKLKEKDVMKQLFDSYEDVLEIFTGTLEKDMKRKMLYESGVNMNSSSFDKSKGSTSGKNRGYMSDYGSDAQMRESINCRSERILEEEHLMIYGGDQYKIYKRALQVEKYFNLVMIIPTVHIINKSTANFYAKSSCEKLVKISKENHNYILTNEDTIDLQGCFQEGEEDISLSDWISIKLTCFGTIYYSKDMIQRHGSGYESKQYALRKKRMKKIPRIFYRVLLCKFEKGQKILIEESKYPPISFINNTKHEIRIEQSYEHFVEEFRERSDMGQYAPKNPYHQPIFKLSIAEHYQYRTILQFGVEQKKTFNLQKQIILQVEEYKDKIIVNIKDKQYVNISTSFFDRSQNLQKNDILLQQTQKYSVEIDKICFSILNSWNKEINSTILQKTSLIFENKNYKYYYKLSIQNIEGYDYMGTQPDYIFSRNKKQKAGLSILQRQVPAIQKFVNLELIVNRHKNAIIIQRCECQLAQSIFYLSAELIIAYIKNYYHPAVLLKTVAKYYVNGNNSQAHQNNKLNYLHKTLIIQSFNWHGTALKFQTRNLTIMEIFLNRSYEKWIVKFINWLGDIKPINFNPLELYYQQITLMRLTKQIDFNKKLTEVGTVLMDYPLSQLKQVFLTFMGDQQRSIKDKAYTFYIIIKSFEYIVTFTLNLNQNFKNQIKTYTQMFIENNKDNPNIINKIIDFQFCQWKYEHKLSLLKLSHKIKRLERYNSRNQILAFDQSKARIKLALDSFINNKLFRPINEVYSINRDYILARVQEWITIVNIKKNEWKIIRLQHIMMFNHTERDLILSYLQDVGQKDKYEVNRQNKSSKIKQIIFKDSTISNADLQILKTQIRDNSLY